MVTKTDAIRDRMLAHELMRGIPAINFRLKRSVSSYSIYPDRATSVRLRRQFFVKGGSEI